MKIYKDQQMGFGIVALVFAIIILAVCALGGWTIFMKQDKTSQPNTSNIGTPTTKPTTQATDPTANWKKVESTGGAYSIRIPDGWELTSYPENLLNGDSISFSKGKPAVITLASSAYAGDIKKFNVSFSAKQYPAPQWQSPNPYGTETKTDFSIGDIKGTKYSTEFTQTVTGATKGDRIYQYVFNLPSGSQLSVVYLQYHDDADNLKMVEQTVKTITVN
jgi:hypothetical protein